ncbi:MAG TPA: bifunctional riboflavin kinase/FMN adenylyltransferase [Chthoniobacterales bacterium]|nr:bifunctional riboflavin kinase/FMN adenylyltransferase [Chthoniobacterales bacterium]
MNDLQSITSNLQPLVIAAGTFDGVHLGHQALLTRAQEEAERLGGEAVVVTFDRHPLSLLKPDLAPKLLTSTAQKVEFFKKYGVEKVLLIPFNEALAAMPAETFIQNLVDFFRNSTNTAKCGVAPVFGASSMLYTLNSCAPSIDSLAPARLTPMGLFETSSRSLSRGLPTTGIPCTSSVSASLERSLVSGKMVKAFCVGAAWSFGQGAQGNLSLLRHMGEELGFSVISITPVQVAGSSVSSTRIRHLTATGHLQEAAKCLGRPYTFRGMVVKGAKLGKKLGFPTANLSMPSIQLPPDGVYAVYAMVEGRRYLGVANIGFRPTIDSTNVRVVEVHLFDFNGDLYNQEVTLEPITYLREEKHFLSLEDLQKQIQCDIEIVQSQLHSD